jgi:hypothetical protein
MSYPYPKVTRQLPVINGFISVPDDQILHPTTLTPQDVINLIPGAKLVKIGVHESDQQFIELPSYVFTAPDDWYAILKAAALT